MGPFFLIIHAKKLQYAIRARDGWAKAGAENRNRVDILAKMEEAAKSNPDTVLSDKEIIAEMMEILYAHHSYYPAYGT